MKILCMKQKIIIFTSFLLSIPYIILGQSMNSLKIEANSIKYFIEEELVSEEEFFEFRRKLKEVKYTRYKKVIGSQWTIYSNESDSRNNLYETKMIFNSNAVIYSIQKVKPEGSQIYKINERLVSKEKLDEFGKSLKEIKGTWFCAETSKGGRTGYDAIDKNAIVYTIRFSSEENISSGSILEKNATENVFYPLVQLRNQMNRDKEVNLIRNSPYKLNETTTITFIAHSHKRTIAGGPKTPLITYIKYETSINGEKESKELELNKPLISERIYNIFFDPEKKLNSGWVWKDSVFILQHYEYNESMKVKIYPSEDYNFSENKFILLDGIN